MPLDLLSGAGAGDAADQIQSILRAVRRHLALDVGFVSEFVAGDRVVRYTDGEIARANMHVGRADPLEKSFCHYVSRGLVPGVLGDAAGHPVTADLPATREVPIGAHISVPLRHDDGTAFGTLCCFSFAPDHSLTARDLGLLRLCADVVAAALRRQRRAELDVEARRARVAGVIERGSLDVVFQPIFETGAGRLTAFEALARFRAEPSRSPDAWFADATEVGLGEELEFLAIRKAVAALAALDPGTNLSVNLSPHLVASPRLADLLAGLPLGRLVLELTENAVVEDYAPLHRALAPLREHGLRLAVDDVGAGHSSFRHVLDLAPEFIKLDKSLIRNIDVDTSRRALAAALTGYGREIGCEVVAEGVETAAEYAVLRALGTTRVQGFLSGRPMALEAAAAMARSGTPFAPPA